MYNGFRIDLYGAKSSCTVLIYSMSTEKGKTQENKNKAPRFDNAGESCKAFSSIIARHINYNFRNCAFLWFFFCSCDTCDKN